MTRSSKIVLAVAFVLFIGSAIVAGIAVKQDWSQYVPDLLSATFTGTIVVIAVSVLLARWQAADSGRQRREAAEGSWMFARLTVRADLAGTWGSNSLDLTDPERDWRRAEGLCKRQYAPMILPWSSAAPNNAELALARSIIASEPKIRLSARELNEVLRNAAEEVRPGSPYGQEAVDAAWLLIRGERPSSGPHVIALAQALLGRRDVEVLVDSYQNEVKDYEGHCESILVLLSQA